MSQPIIEVDHLWKSYRLGERASYLALRDIIGQFAFRRPKTPTFWALENLHFSVNQGEVLGVIGRNGAGKSTLLKILSRITPPSRGKITMHGRVASLLEVGTGFHPELTGRENIYLNGAILGMAQREIRAKFEAIVAFAEIDEFLDTPVKRYSSGMYVRLAFAVAAHLEPEILLVDEVLAVGDAAFQKKCLGKMSDVVREGGRTILFVSHNMGAIQTLCPRSLLLHQGKIDIIGPTPEVIDRYLNQIQAPSEAIDLRDRSDRQGTGRIRLTKITLANQSGRPVRGFRVGETVSLIFDYQASSQSAISDELQVAVGLNNHLGERIANLSTKTVGTQFRRLSPAGRLVVTLPDLPLAPGRYYLTVFVELKNEICDWVIDAASFDVDFGDFYGTGQLPPEGQGNILLRYHWTVADEK